MFGLFTKTTDPVCGMKINKKEAKFTTKKDGISYYFCSINCKDSFEKDPKKFEQANGGACCH